MYMLDYSPCDQVKPQAYPNMLVTTGLHTIELLPFSRDARILKA